MITTDQGPTWCEWIAAAIDTYPMAKRRLSERSALIKRAHQALLEQDDVAGCASILGSLVEKAGAAVPELSESNIPNENITFDPEGVSVARLMTKRDALLAFRDRLRQWRGQEIGKAGHEERVVIATRLTKAEVERKAMLAHRLSLIRGQFDAQRSWQPMR
jgi:hypothetical protein